eukprot:gb/GEZN01000499.1/.p1 GENE.gb/GEZN01000499.1/~~gb/GEZN01000499.1/.p1  ORF type:complete len:1342 (+),score=173.08 gb/GEZN01000499.1/:57-4082(+)
MGAWLKSLLGLVLWLPALSHARHQSVTVREKMLKVLPYRENSLSVFAPRFFATFPRQNGVTSFGVVHLDDFDGATWLLWWGGANNVKEGTQAHDYIYGIMSSVVILCLFFAFMVLASCTTFVAMRACCNSCGGRQVMPVGKKYQRGHVLTIRFCTAFMFVMCLMLFGLTMSANTGISHGLNNAFKHMETLEFFIWDLHGPFVEVNGKVTEGANKAELLSTSFDTYLYMADGQFLSSEAACVNQSYTTFALQTSVRQTLFGLKVALTVSGVSQTNRTLRSVQSALSSGWPNAATISTDVFGLQSSVDRTLQPLLLFLIPKVDAMDATLTALQPEVDSSTLRLDALTANETTMKDGLLSDALNATTTLMSELAALNPSALATAVNMADIGAQGTTDLNAFIDNLTRVPQGTSTELKGFKVQVDLMRATIAALKPVLQSISSRLTSTLYGGAADLDTIITKLTELISFPSIVVDGTTDVISRCIAAHATLAGYPNLTESEQLLVSKPFSGGQTLVVDVNLLNVTLSKRRLGCLDDLLTKLEGFNSSIFVLPTLLDNFKQNRLQVQDQRSELDVILTNLTARNANLLAIQNAIVKLDWVNVSEGIQALGNLYRSQSYDALASKLSSFNNLLRASKRPPDGWDTTLQDLKSATVPSMRTQLTNTLTSLSTFETSLTTLSTKLAIQTPLVLQYEQSQAALESPFSCSPSCSDPPDSQMDACASPQCYPRGMLGYAKYKAQTSCCDTKLRADLVAALTTMNTTISVLDLSSIRSPMQAVYSSIPHNDFSTAFAQLANLQSKLSSVASKLGGLNHSSDVLHDLQSGLLAVTSEANVVADAGVNVGKMPNLASVAAGLDSCLPLAGGFLDELVQLIPDSTNFLTQAEAIEAQLVLADMTSLEKGVQDFQNVTALLRQSAERCQYTLDEFVRVRLAFDQSKNDMWNNLDEWDMLRLIIVNLVIGIPLLFALAAVYGCAKRRGGPSMLMAILFFGVVPFFFLVASFLAPTATVLADQCRDPTAFVRLQAEAASMNVTTFRNITGIPVTQDVDLGYVYDYYTTCQGNEPEFVVLARDSVGIMQDWGYNFSSYRDKLSSSNVALSNATAATLADMDRLVLECAVIFNHTLDHILTCDRVMETYFPFLDSLCGEFAGAVALCTGLYIVFAACLTPGILVGVKGYKLLPTENEMSMEEELRDQVRKEKLGGKPKSAKSSPNKKSDQKSTKSVSSSKKQIEMSKLKEEGQELPEAIPLQRAATQSISRSRSPTGLAAAPQAAVARPKAVAQALWTCSSCTFMNQPSVDLCQMCFTPKDAAVGLDAPIAARDRQRSFQMPPGGIVGADGAVIIPAGTY